MRTKISSALDSIADHLEARGLVKEAYEVDKIADALEKAAGSLGESLKKMSPEDIKNLEVQVTIGTGAYQAVVNAGLKDDLLNLFKKGKNAWQQIWGGVKDGAVQTAIKGIKSIGDIKEFLRRYPGMSAVLLSAIFLGFVSLPQDATAALLPDASVAELTQQLVDSDAIRLVDNPLYPTQAYPAGPMRQIEDEPIVVRKPQIIKVTLPQGWLEEVLLFSMKGHAFNDSSSWEKDLKDNESSIIDNYLDMADVPHYDKRSLHSKIENALSNHNKIIINKYRASHQPN